MDGWIKSIIKQEKEKSHNTELQSYIKLSNYHYQLISRH